MRIKVLPILTIGLMFFLVGLTACLSDDTAEITYSSEHSITALSLGTVKRQIVGKDKNGEDSVYTDTMSVSNYPFTIDQRTRVIENKDSLPVGVDLSKIILNISGDTPYIFYGKITERGGEAKDTLWTSTDSIDFSVAPEEGLAFKVYTYTGTLGAAYHVKVNVHKQEPDSLQWYKGLLGTPFSEPLVKQKAIFTGGKIYVFGETADGTPVMESTAVSGGQPRAWSSESLPVGTDTYSAVVFNGIIYFLVSNELYEVGAGGFVKSGASRNDLAQLIAGVTTLDGSNSKLYAQTTDGKAVSLNSSFEWSDPEDATFPAGTHFAYDTIPVTYNKKLAKTVIMGYNTGGKYGYVASRLTNDNVWNAYDYEQVDTFRCPNIANPSLIYYDKKLCLFGGNIAGEEFSAYQAPFSVIFVSTDNGLTWKPTTHSLAFATEKGEKTFAQLYQEHEGNYSCVVDTEHFIWVIWKDGTMSRGRVNHYGFLPKVW